VATEAQHQTEVVKWLRTRGWCFTATANGVMTTPAQWRHLARTGVSPGVPDLLVFEPLGRYVGVAIEMKAAKGRVSPEQVRWLEWLRQRTWYAFVAYSAEEAIRKMEELERLDPGWR
jgi:hypothetical protein